MIPRSVLTLDKIKQTRKIAFFASNTYLASPDTEIPVSDEYNSVVYQNVLGFNGGIKSFDAVFVVGDSRDHERVRDYFRRGGVLAKGEFKGGSGEIDFEDPEGTDARKPVVKKTAAVKASEKTEKPKVEKAAPAEPPVAKAKAKKKADKE